MLLGVFYRVARDLLDIRRREIGLVFDIYPPLAGIHAGMFCLERFHVVKTAGVVRDVILLIGYRHPAVPLPLGRHFEFMSIFISGKSPAMIACYASSRIRAARGPGLDSMP